MADERPFKAQPVQVPIPVPGVGCSPGNDYELMLTTLPNGLDGNRLRVSVLLSPRLKPACDVQLAQFAPIFTDWPSTVRAMKFEFVFESTAGTVAVTPQPLWSPDSLDSNLYRAIFKDTTLVRRYEFDRGQRANPGKFQPLALRERNLYRSMIKQDIYQQIALSSPTKLPTRAEFTQHMERAGIVQRVPSLRTPGQFDLRLGVEQPITELLNVRQRLINQESKLFLKPGAAPQLPGQAPVLPRGLEGPQLSGALRTVPYLRDDAQVRAATDNRFNAKQLDFLEFQAFVLRPGAEKSADLRRRPKPALQDWQRILDFHQILASLGDFPELLKRLGLRLDFAVQDPRLQGPGAGFVRLTQAPPGGRILSPKTRYLLGAGFRAEPSAGSDISDGFLAFGKKDQAGLPVFDVVPGDVEGTVAKITNFTQMLLEPGRAGLTPADPRLPALRSAGLAVAHSQRDTWLQGLMIRAAQMNAALQQGGPIVFAAEDLVRGLRIDVREVRQAPNAPPQFGPWRSLCDRRGAYFLGANLPPVLEQQDEGWMSLAVTESQAAVTAAQAPTPLLLYESLFRWSGWSLCVPRPGNNLPDGAPPQQQAPVPGLNFFTIFSPVPGTLPRLRFGQQYQFRARVVDLAGNSRSVQEAPQMPDLLVTSLNDGYYDRFEPAGSPAVVLTNPIKGAPSPLFPEGEPVSPGESVSHLVIRSLNLERPGDPREGAPAGPATPATARHIVPPKISQDLAEAHGLFDNPQTRLVGGVEAYRLMVAKDGALSQTETQQDVHPEPSIIVPYLPDPMAAGATFFNLPGTDARTGFLWSQPFEGEWPNRKSFRIQVEAGMGPPQFQNGVLRVFVPIGEQRTVDLSCFLRPTDERLFGVWRWIEERATPQDRDTLRALIRQGRHWMITPARRLVLIHAVQQPVLTPQWVLLRGNPQRGAGQTAISLEGTLAIHRASTDKFDLHAEWMEPIDQGVMKADPREWLYVNGNATAFEIKVAPPVEPALAPIVPRGVAGEGDDVPNIGFDIPQDGKEIPLLADERTESEVQPRGLSNLGVLKAPSAAQAPIMAPPATPKAPVQAPKEQQKPPYAVELPQQPGIAAMIAPGRPAYDESKHRCAAAPPPPPPDYGERLSFQGLHRFTDTKYRCVGYVAVAATRYRDFFRPVAAEQGPNPPPRFTRSSPVLKVDVLSSAPPDAPKVLYVIPTFRWEETPQGRRRSGGGLRIYLDRPWYSSGDGEQLAVILHSADYPDIVEPEKPYVTQWGLDPLWQGTVPVPGSSELGPIMRPGVDPKAFVIPRGDEPGGTAERGVPDLGIAQTLQQGQAAKDILIAQTTGPGRTYPQPQHFRNAAATRQDLYLHDAIGRWPKTIKTPSGGVASQLPLEPTALPVTICAFNVYPDPSRQLWYCDIELDPGTAYFPFIRLALARYQVNSIPEKHLSKLVLADVAQLLPDRTASVARLPSNPNVVTISVVGSQGHIGPPRTSLVEVAVEEFNPNVPDELGWTPVPNLSPITLSRADTRLWTGQVGLPPSTGQKQYRLVIKEYEVFQVAGEPDTARQQERRMVYADAMPVR